MAVPKSIKFGDSSDGILIEYVKSRNVLRISGWYDDIVGIAAWEIPLKEFCDKLGIKELFNHERKS